MIYYNKIISNQFRRKLKFLLEPIKIKEKSQYTSNVMNYAKFYKKIKVDQYSIIYQVRDGKSMTDSPYAIFNYLLKDKDFYKYKHIWVMDTVEKQKKYKKKYNENKNVKFILKESREYRYYLAKCKYIINNSTFPSYFTKKINQIYINTWHGTPFKFMGLDVHDNLEGSQNTIRNFLCSDYIISPNAHTTEVFKRAFKLDNLKEHALLETGYPRIDTTLTACKEVVKEKIIKSGITINEKPILLFSPTWRGEQVNNPQSNIDEIIEIIEHLNSQTNYQVLVKVHPFIYSEATKNNSLKPYLIDDEFDTNELLSVIDLLVTDYSSIFFDFLVTEKPIVFYTSDYTEYKAGRGLYLPLESLPGPSVSSPKELVKVIQNADMVLARYKDNYKKYINKFSSFDDGHATERIVDHIFRKKIQTSRKKNKENILFYAGGMKSNGITTSITNLLENIDYKKFDVTIFTTINNDKDSLENIKNINSKVRIISRRGPLLANTVEYYKNILIRNRGLNTKYEEKIYPSELYEREFRKIFGDSKFDYAIDFSGYSMFWSELILSSQAKKKIVYLHSDMKMDMERTVNGIRPHYSNLKGMISMYRFFDELVNVSEVTKNENIKKIGESRTHGKFVSAVNVINIEKIKRQVMDDSDIYIKNDIRVILRVMDNKISSVPFIKEDYKVITMGRLSPEKGFDNLIRAFLKIVAKHPSAKLYILGEGPLRNSLNKLINSLKLSDNVFLMGQKRNPFYIMKECDLFVLPSLYEGQSMVLLEALTIGINIMASKIPANEYVLDYGKYGMLSQNNIDSLYKGIDEFINNDIPNYADFDAELYNQEAINQFYNLLKI